MARLEDTVKAAGETLRKGARSARTKATTKVRELETNALAAEGRRSLKAKARTTATVARKAARTGAIVGALASVAVILREVRRRHGA